MKFFQIFVIFFFSSSLYADELKLGCLKNFNQVVKSVDKVLIHPDVEFSPEIKLTKPKEYRGALTSSCQNELGIKGDLRIIVDGQKLISLEIFSKNKEPGLLKYLPPEEIPVLEKGLYEWGMAFHTFEVKLAGNNMPIAYEIIAVSDEGFHERLSYYSEETSQYQ